MTPEKVTRCAGTAGPAGQKRAPVPAPLGQPGQTGTVLRRRNAWRKRPCPSCPSVYIQIREREMREYIYAREGPGPPLFTGPDRATGTAGPGGCRAGRAAGQEVGRHARTGGAGEGATVSGYDVWGCGRPGPPPPLSEKIHPGAYWDPITSSGRAPLTHSIGQWASHNLERAHPITP